MGVQEKYNDAFPARLRKLIDDRGTTITAVSKELGISRQAVSQYADGSAQPNVDKLVSIARFFNVSTDYLVGLSDYEQRSTGDLTAADMGIADEAAKQLAEDKVVHAGISGMYLSMLAKSPQFSSFALAVSDYIGAVDRAHKWGNTLSGVVEERRNVRMKQFLLSEALFDVLNDWIKQPDFPEKERIARERERKYHAFNQKKDN